MSSTAPAPPAYTPGPPPDGFEGLILAVLDPARFAPGNPDPWDEYYGDPVVVCWERQKGKTTFGVKTIHADDVARHVALPATLDGRTA